MTVERLLTDYPDMVRAGFAQPHVVRVYLGDPDSAPSRAYRLGQALATL